WSAAAARGHSRAGCRRRDWRRGSGRHGDRAAAPARSRTRTRQHGDRYPVVRPQRRGQGPSRRTPRFRNRATNFRLSRILVVANICTNPCDISAIAEEGGWHVHCLIRGRRPVAGGLMSTFDNPFDPDRRLRAGGCSCGQHVSEAEHEHAALALRCEPQPTEDKRYEGVVASAVMRAMFPKDVARRAFLKSVGASTALAAISQFFPLQTATELFAQG